MIMIPEMVNVEFPRDALHKGLHQDTAGAVFPGMDLSIMFQVIYNNDMGPHRTITISPFVWPKQYFHIWLLVTTVQHRPLGKCVWISKYTFCVHLCRSWYIFFGTSSLNQALTQAIVGMNQSPIISSMANNAFFDSAWNHVDMRISICWGNRANRKYQLDPDFYLSFSEQHSHMSFIVKYYLKVSLLDIY